MSIFVKLVETESERKDALSLVRESYLHSFGLDLNDLPRKESFESDILIACSAGHELLGTMGILFADSEGKYSSEALFGYDLSGIRADIRGYSEIGRFATAQAGKLDPKAVISLFLGAISYHELRGIPGWIATVKDDVFDFLASLKLPMIELEQMPHIAENDPLRKYVGDGRGTHLIQVKIEDTRKAYDRFYRLKEAGVIRVAFENFEFLSKRGK